MNVIFMGTPAFGVPTLQALINSSAHKVTAVFTQEPKAKGRGMKSQLSPIHTLAKENNIPVHTPSNLKTTEAYSLIESIKADIIVVVAYGFIIPKNILSAKKYGCINLHPSKLPRYRGAAPLQRTIINGDLESAVCVIQMDEGLDTGDIILQEDFILPPGITLTELHDKCAKLGKDLIIKTLDNLNSLPRVKQSSDGIVYAPKLTKEEGRISWNNTAREIDCRIRGMTPWPSAYFNYNGNTIKILEAKIIKGTFGKPPGTILDQEFTVVCKEDALRLIKIQPENKAPMLAADYLRGLKQ